MLNSTLGARYYFFACSYLWDVLLLFNYLDEEVSPKRIDAAYFFKWSKHYEDLANWCLEERFFPIDLGEIVTDEKNLLLSTAEKLGESLVLEFGNLLYAAAIKMHQKFPILDESMWLYYWYCRFLRQTIMELGFVLQAPDSSPVYFARYQANNNVFNALVNVLEQERPFPKNEEGVNQNVREYVWKKMDTFVPELGAKWRKAVLIAAHNLELPDFR